MNYAVNTVAVGLPKCHSRQSSKQIAGVRGEKSRVSHRCRAEDALQSSRTSDIPGIEAITVSDPFAECLKEVNNMPKDQYSKVSLARQYWTEACELAVNQQINQEYSNSYVYHAAWAYFDRDNVGLPGIAAFLKEQSLEERTHAERLMEYQNLRGGTVKLQSLLLPPLDFSGNSPGEDALYAFEVALAMERLNNEKLLAMRVVAEESSDFQFGEFIEGQFLNEQVDDIRKMAIYVSQLRRAGTGLGVFEFDRYLQNGGDA